MLPGRRRPTRIRAAAGLLAALWLLVGCDDAPSVHVLEGRTMGTTYSIQIVDPEPDREALGRAIERELDTLDRQLSTWRDDSEIARFNQLPADEWFLLSPAFAAVLERALELGRATGGALDPSVLPLSRAWGFQGDRAPAVPITTEIEELLTHTGADLVLLERDADGARARKADPRVEIDLSALAKGYAVDRLTALAELAGGRNYLVEIGGEVRTAGRRADGTPWRVALEGPDGLTGGVVLLEDEAVATSGDYRNYFEAGGVRHSHVLDPRTGRPVAHATTVATVIAEDTMTADGLATAFLVLPPAEALAVADELGVALGLQLRGEEGFEMRSNAAFDQRRR
jgi:thiamine biosynthesis lipoprotein